MTATIFTGSILTRKCTLDIFDRVYYMRALVGVVAGIVAGAVIQVEYDQNASAGIAILIAIVFYFISYAISKGIAKKRTKGKAKKGSNRWDHPVHLSIIHVHDSSIHRSPPVHSH
jgi:hypothetical protein